MDSIPLEIWEEMFRKWLDVGDLVHLSGVSRYYRSVSKKIMAYQRLPSISFYRKIPHHLCVKDIYQVKGWPNIAFFKSIYLNDLAKDVHFHQSFQTWKFFPNVYFSINCWRYSKELPEGYESRIIHVDSGDPKLLEGKTPYLSFANLDSPIVEKPSRYVKGVHFRYCDNTNLEGYSQLDEIEINNPNIMDDISPLEGIRKVSIRHHFFLFDIFPLRFSEEVDLTGCMEVEDFRPLQNVKYLTLDQTLITDISFLKNVEKLSLDSCKFLQNIEHLKEMKNLRRLNINRCHQIESLEPLRDLKKLKWVSLNNCYMVDNVSMLGNVNYLDISRTSVSDVSLLGGLETLIMRSTLVEDVSMLNGLKKINITGCNKIKDISMLDKVKIIITDFDRKL